MTIASEPAGGQPLAGMVAVVVGFTNPVGLAVAQALAAQGADIAAASATLDGDEVMAAKRAARTVQRAGRRAFSQGWDVTLPTNVQVGLKQLIRELGHPTVLVYNADAALFSPIEKTSDAQFGRIHQVNLAGAFYAARSFVRELPDGTPGRIVFVTARFEGGLTEPSSAYAAAKHGVHGLTAALAPELAGRGVAVHCLDAGVAMPAPESAANSIAGLVVALALGEIACASGEVIPVPGGAAAP